jgi:hypothetical protein
MFAKFKNPVTRAFMRYTICFSLSMFAYVVVLALSRNLLERGYFAGTSPTTRLLIIASPVVPFFFVFLSFIRLLFQIDEFLRKQFINTLCIAGGITAFLSVAYGLIEQEQGLPCHFPRPSAWWTWTAYMSSWMGSWCIISITAGFTKFFSRRNATLP